MISKAYFIKATEEYNTPEKNVPAHYFRRTYHATAKESVRLTIAVCGFYQLYLNGECITKGFLSPYISNTDDYIYFDTYEVVLEEGENVIGVLLGNGLQNNPGGHVWDFDKAPFRSVPMLAMTLEKEGRLLLSGDSDFKVFPSPIRSDDYRFGEVYDANFETDGWNQKGFDDTAWKSALPATPPKGELRHADIAPIILECEIAPVEIIPTEGGYVYDFGISNAGVCRLRINGTKGQRIELLHAEALKAGEPDLIPILCDSPLLELDFKLAHKDVYVCRGGGTEIYQPTFTYHGFRYVKVSGITEEQATRELLTYLVYHTDLHTRGDFSCSDPIATTLQKITRRSILSNFHHFPTDCPQREKNGWTADAALTCETALLNFDPEINYREWLKNIYRAQAENGSLPGIIPTGGWGFHLNGPAWDCVIAWIPYYTYIYRGETAMIEEAAPSLLAYLRYLRTRCDEKGLLAIGLGDWCHVGRDNPKAPLLVTDTVTSMDIAAKAAFMLDAVGMRAEADFARAEASAYRAAIRAHLVDFDKMLVAGNCQASQAMALHYGVFDECEKVAAFQNLLMLIHEADDHIDVGVLGGRVIFHVLSRFGYSDLAYRMITREDYPSYGNWLNRGATTLWENFLPDSVSSMNHHFWGDISGWFIQCIAGIRINPARNDTAAIKIAPSFISALSHASAYHITPHGTVRVAWRREKDGILLEVEIPEACRATAELEAPFCFADGTRTKSIVSGDYQIASPQ